jgi:hypothetical protein
MKPFPQGAATTATRPHSCLPLQNRQLWRNGSVSSIKRSISSISRFRLQVMTDVCIYSELPGGFVSITLSPSPPPPLKNSSLSHVIRVVMCLRLDNQGTEGGQSGASYVSDICYAGKCVWKNQSYINLNTCFCYDQLPTSSISASDDHLNTGNVKQRVCYRGKYYHSQTPQKWT